MTSLALLLAAALSAGNAEFERAANRLAADIAFTRLKTEIVENGLVTNALERAMLERPDAFRGRSDAEHLCREIYTNELARLYRARATEIVRELGEGAEAASPDAQTLEESMRRHFDRTFGDQRASACRIQAQGIALKVKPDEADIEAKGDDEVRGWLTDRIVHAKGMSVFEENVKYVSEQIVDPVLADARKERKRQQEYLMRTRCDAYAPSALAKEIEANLRKNVAERNAKCDDPLKAWGVFPSTLKAELPSAVERRVVGLVLKEIDDVPLGLDEQGIRAAITADPAAHRQAAASEKIFRERFEKELADAAFAKAESSAPSAERAEFAAYVRERAQTPEFARAVDARLKRDALPKWRKVRAELVKSETERRWPTLTDKTWYPDADFADRTAARSDYAAALRDWRKAPELAALAGKDGALEESDAAADKSVAAAFDLARSAIAAQRAIVADVHPLVLTAAKDLSKGLFTSKPDLAAVTEMLTKSVESEWGEKRVATLWGDRPRPKNAEEQHRELFPSVKREIELVARQILEEMEKIESKAKVEDENKQEEKKDESKPEEPPPEESPPEPSKEEPEEEVCTISFEISGGEVTVQAKRGSSLVAERKAKATAKGFEDAVREVGAIVGRKIFRLK